MLVLGRKVGEKILIPQYNITIVVIETSGSRVRLGFRAPSDVEIVREELASHSAPKEPEKKSAGRKAKS